MAQLTQKQVIIIITAVLLLGGGYFLFSLSVERNTPPPDITLSLWGTVEPGLAIEKLIAGHKAARPNVTLSYRYIPEAEYRKTLLDAIASGEGPDVLMFDSRSLFGEQSKLVSAPEELISLSQFRTLFPEVAEQDLVREGGIYGIPFYIDTLALIYNRDSFDQAAIPEPPRTWQDVETLVPVLRAVNESGQLTRAAVAIGGTERSARNSIDLLHLLMLQNGVAMTDRGGMRASFHTSEEGVNFGLQALNFYLQFANAASSRYTWNESQPDPFDGIATGRTAMVFGYREDAASLRRANPFARIGVAEMPQPEGATRAVNYARYWAFGVPRASANGWWAWDFIVQSASNQETMRAFTDATGRPPALRSLLGQYYTHPDLGVFAKQVLTARSWMQADASRVRDIFNTVIGMVLSGQINSQQALRQAEDQVTQLMIQTANQ